MIKITSLRNDKLGIAIPQMAFERRVDDFIDFYVVMLTEKSIWQAIENTGVAYENWIAFRDAENLLLNISIELKDGYQVDAKQLASQLYDRLIHTDSDKASGTVYDNNLMDMTEFGLKVDLLPKGTFAGYIARRQAEGADLAHLKPPHINPSQKILSMITAESEETIIVTKTGVKARVKTAAEKVAIS